MDEIKEQIQTEIQESGGLLHQKECEDILSQDGQGRGGDLGRTDGWAENLGWMAAWVEHLGRTVSWVWI